MNDTVYDLRMKAAIANTRRIQSPTQPSNQKQTHNTSFDEVLRQRVQENSSIEFSKHAINRVQQRNITIADSTLERLEQGVALAKSKGLNSTLILVDQTAFVVNVQNNKVITTMSDETLKGNVITNIDGTVII